MTGDLTIRTQGEVDGNRWGIMLAVSIVLHVSVFSAAIFLPGLMQSSYTDNIVYEVDLVDMPSNIQAETPSASKSEETTAKTETTAKRIETKEEKKTKIEVEKIPVNKKKTPVKKVETAKAEKNSKAEDSNHLNQAISDLKKKAKSEENDQTHLDQAISKLQTKAGGTASKGNAAGTGTIGSLAMRIYQENVKAHIEDNWSYPAALENGKDLEVTVLLKVKEDGTILESKVSKNSKNSVFDQSVLKAIKKSNPIPPLPEGYEKSYEEFIFNFTLKDLLDNN